MRSCSVRFMNFYIFDPLLLEYNVSHARSYSTKSACKQCSLFGELTIQKWLLLESVPEGIIIRPHNCLFYDPGFHCSPKCRTPSKHHEHNVQGRVIPKLVTLTQNLNGSIYFSFIKMSFHFYVLCSSITPHRRIN